MGQPGCFCERRAAGCCSNAVSSIAWPARALDLQAAALRKYRTRDVERKKELAKLQAQLKRAEAKNKELQVRYGNRPDQRRPRTAVY